MNNDRLSHLLAFFEEDPDDPFNIYALATEYLKSDLTKSRVLFENLLQNHPDYLATYYHAAQLYFDLEEMELAKTTYLKGIETATIQKKDKALKELKGAYQLFLDELTED
ncbi:hypothetical protein SAMN04515674_11738 [Pseudarcicella hirudinis]|uniref:Tetratricopeptide repeat-containing protein n=1 Tax=Pseudarcicella hirudinis TaxID=1079859 RepID=A0A1I5Y6A2_9BACT|nr:enzyme of heme biosynthesis [Pseudarcicella hirudinis]SFQ39640.1 hypothetical protein SAMN04515674_11738 [Pseudarcicella hirudinis]